MTQSQISIEKNSAWILSYLRASPRGYGIDLLYTDGNAPEADVFQVVEPASTLDQLRLIFGEDELHRYTNSRLADQVGPSTVESVTENLARVLSAPAAKEGVTLIYQGHGDFAPEGVDRNYLRLWEKGRLPAIDLEKIVSDNHREGEFRFLFTQCFSGSFARIIYPGMDPKRGLTSDQRCGFVAQLEFLPSEGCTPSVNEAGYRDYSTYFFEALGGVRRTGEKLPENPDYDGDGRVGMREAHLYTLRNAFSVDYSRATSEVYLEDWSTWYTRWLPAKVDQKGDYYRAAAKIAADRGMAASLLESRPDRHRWLAGKREELRQAVDELQRKQANYQALRTRVANAMQARWPALPAYIKGQGGELTDSGFEAIRLELDRMVQESGFVDLRATLSRLGQANTDREREVAQVVKIDRMLELARLRALFERLAAPAEKAEYQRLVRCEEGFL